MRCPIIRDLLPYYLADECSEQSKKENEQHIQECPACHRLYVKMKIPINIKEPMVEMTEEVQVEMTTKDCDRDRDFWMKYYASLIFKGGIIFLAIYFIMTWLAFLK